MTKVSNNEQKSIKDSTRNKVRSSNIELYRIIIMLFIIAHHYVVNSGIISVIGENGYTNPNSLFLLLFGFGGKTGINCFVLITGYYMCTSNITLKKFIKLLFEVEFYKILFYFIFLVSGYEEFSLKSCIKSLLPFYAINKNFVGCYLVFFCFIPFLNILISNMKKYQHRYLLILCIISMSVFPTLKMNVVFSYVSWFMVVYIVGSYIRLYPSYWFDNKRISIISTMFFLFISLLSVIIGAIFAENYGKEIYYYFVSDSNKLLPLFLAISSFCLFKNIMMRYNKFINIVARSCFGVLLIHTINATMREWLWFDALSNVSFYDSDYLVVHALLSVFGIFIVCTLIDYIRIELFEKRYLALFDKMISSKKVNKFADILKE